VFLWIRIILLHISHQLYPVPNEPKIHFSETKGRNHAHKNSKRCTKQKAKARGRKDKSELHEEKHSNQEKRPLPKATSAACTYLK